MSNSVYVASFRDGVATLDGKVLEFESKSDAWTWIREHISINSRVEDKWSPALLIKENN